mmetsp:Transcript_27659/g.44968  ORF Transcript_27659/g.44968 Transcript_27659/m.44968 type:complete len:477 (+) Transcript_27659:193-1623(+)|eukprot:CAMPEP_0184659016 /NCGR_PEP_ID=MMETSP0308-20130426/27788_1 /TAXON_ID=38269 /ORGANISM="Gloeochaete witrockiana, Strain SAG 46.84" /LENGTH=476 /DNA_ID=CAMNT_0027098459 /DNA_START=111 /DNA_END=1541 /DNA_ORIENTATION=-
MSRNRVLACHLVVCLLLVIIASSVSGESAGVINDDVQSPCDVALSVGCDSGISQLGSLNDEIKLVQCFHEDVVVQGGIYNPIGNLYSIGQAEVPAGHRLVLTTEISTGLPNEPSFVYLNDVVGYVHYTYGQFPIPGSYTYYTTVTQNNISQSVGPPICYSEDTLVGVLLITSYYMNAAMPNNGATVLVKMGVEPCVATPTPAPMVFGDPHLRTFDGLGVTYVDCGDYVLAQSPVGGGLMYQSRFCRRGNDASSTCAVAVQCTSEADTAEVYTLGLRSLLLVAGRAIRLPRHSVYNAAAVTIEHDNEQFDLRCDSGAVVSLFVRTDADQNYVDASLHLSPAYKGQTDGLLGIWDGKAENDVAFRNGRGWSDGHGLDYISAIDHPSIADVQSSWLVTPEEDLFSLTAKQSEAECGARSLRRILLGLKEDGVTKADAEKACTGLGMQGVYLQTCMFDYVATGGSTKFISNTADFLKRHI